MFNRYNVIRSGIAGLYLGAALGLGNCGIVPVGAANCPNDAVPSGSIVYQGPFTAANGGTASGAAEVYNSGGNYTVRLDGVSFTPPNSQTTGLQVVGAGGSFTTSLNSLCGSQNYSAGTTLPSSSQIQIFSNINSVNYAQAILTAVH